MFELIFSSIIYMDNRYFKEGCPPLMSDGRFVTSYVDSDILVQFIRHVNEIGSSQDFKNFMQKNAVEIMNKERNFVVEKNTCEVNGKCSGPVIEGFDNEELYGNIEVPNVTGEINVENYSDNSNQSRFGK